MSGTKVTDPKAIIPESVGMVTSDSLAAESLANSDSFASNNPYAAASSQPSHSTTANNSDVSVARKIDPAPTAEARDVEQEWSETARLNAGAGLAKDDDATGYPSSATEQNANTAPSYATASQAVDPSVLKPHGKNIKEGGFGSDAPNASFNNEIGTKKDPGRVAEKKFAEQGGDAAGGARQAKVADENPYKPIS